MQHNTEEQRVQKNAGSKTALFRKPTMTRRDRRMDLAAAAVLRARGLAPTARSVRGLVNAARPFMDDGRGRYEAVSMAGCYIRPGHRLPRWLR